MDSETSSPVPSHSQRSLNDFYEQKAAVYQKLDDRVGIREQRVLELFPRQTSLRVLDVGCGSGRFLRTLKALGHEAVGVDISEKAVAMAKESGVQASVANLETGAGLDSLGNNFDVIVALDVLEHTFDPAAVLRRLALLMRPQSCLVVSVPNIACLPARLKLMRGHFPVEKDGIFDSGHVRWFTKSSLRKCAKSAGGFELDALTGTPLPSLSVCGLWRLEGAQTSVLSRLATAWPGLWAYQLVARLRKTA